MPPTSALVVDDNVQNLKVLSTLLSKQGVACVETTDPTAVEGLLATGRKFDMVFLDLEMPNLDGYKLKEVIRAKLGATLIIACTVHVSEMGVVRDLGFDGFIGKPLDPTRFREQIARLLRGEAVWDRI